MSRREYTAFLTDIRERGIVTPLEVTAEGLVLDGRHRLQAALELGLESVPIQLCAPADPLAWMLRAALQRRHLSQSQKAALALDLEQELLRAARADATLRRHATLRQNAAAATLPQRRARVRQLAAEIAGVSERTMQDAITVHAHDAQLFAQIKAGALPAHTARRQLERRERHARIPKAPPLPHGPYQLILADPPWQLGNPHSPYAPEEHYPTMTLEQIKRLLLPAADAAVLFLWVPSGLLQQGLEVMHSWGFTYRTNLVWVKNYIGLGQYVRNRHELLLLGRRGNFPLADPEDRPDSVIQARRGRHSEKPTAVYALIEQMYPAASKLELFARGRRRPGWTAWGNEVEIEAA